LAADEAGFSRIAHGQYAIFIALLRGGDESRVLNNQKMFKNYSKASKRRKINRKYGKG
jgi:hypothetical protein